MIHVTTRPYSFHGSFYDTTTQTTSSANVPVVMKFNTTDQAEGVTITSGSQINILNTGTYNIQFSAQFDKVNASPADFYVWLATDSNVYVPWSNGQATLAGSSKSVPSWNFIQDFVGGQHFHLFWLATDTNIRIVSASAPGNGMPAIPSTAVTVTQV